MDRESVSKEHAPVQPHELLEIATRLQEQAGSVTDERRAAPRAPRISCDAHLTIHHPGGGRSCFLASTRNMSRTGICLLMGGFAHVGSTCVIILETTAARLEPLLGTIMRCRHVERRVHELGVQFDREIDPRPFVDPVYWAQLGHVPQAAETVVDAYLVYIGGTSADRALFDHHARSLRWRSKGVSTVGPALDEIKTSHVDAVFHDVDLAGERQSLVEIKRVCESAYEGPSAAVTADPIRLERLRGVVSGTLLKPYSAPDLCQLVIQLIGSVRSARLEGPVYSTKAKDAALADLTSNFVDDAHQVARQLRQALDADDLESIRGLCLSIKGIAEPCGFDILTEIATATLRALEDAEGLRDAVSNVSELIRACELTRKGVASE